MAIGDQGQEQEHRWKDWVFHQKALGKCCYVVEGSDSRGNVISLTGTDPEILLEDCIREAQEMRNSKR